MRTFFLVTFVSILVIAQKGQIFVKDGVLGKLIYWKSLKQYHCTYIAISQLGINNVCVSIYSISISIYIRADSRQNTSKKPYNEAEPFPTITFQPSNTFQT